MLPDLLVRAKLWVLLLRRLFLGLMGFLAWM